MESRIPAKQVMYNELKRIWDITKTLKFEEALRKADNFISNTVFLDFEDYIYGDELNYIIRGSIDEGGFLTLSAGYDKYEMMYDVDFDLDKDYLDINIFNSQDAYEHWAYLLEIIRKHMEKKYLGKEDSEDSSNFRW